MESRIERGAMLRTGRAGRMTAAMRAAAPERAKVLRVALLGGGRVLEERIFLRPAPVTVGDAESATFVVSAPGLHGRTVLFEPADDGAVLHLARGMTATLARGTRTTTEVGPATIELDESTRGKIGIGASALLFQFVAPPPAQSKPQLPASVVARASDVDWWIATCAAFSFLAHFAAVGLFYSDWGDRIVPDEGRDVAGLVERLPTLPPAPLPEPPRTDANETAGTQSSETASRDTGKKVDGRKGDGRPKGAKKESDGASLLAQLDAFDRDLVGVFSTTHAATDGVLRDGNVPTNQLGEVARSEAGAKGSDPSGLHLDRSGGAIDPSGKRSLASLSEGGERVTDRGGVAQTVQAPKPSVSTTSSTRGGHINGAEAVLARARGAVRQCYMRGLGDSPDMEGRVTFTISVGGGGNVTSVSVTPSGSIGGGVSSCIQGVLRGLAFEPPEGGSAVVSGSFGLVNANRGR